MKKTRRAPRTRIIATHSSRILHDAGLDTAWIMTQCGKVLKRKDWDVKWACHGLPATCKKCDEVIVKNALKWFRNRP